MRAFKEVGISPIVVESGAGDTLYDADGNSYIDYCMSWGAMILGHAHPAVVEAVCARVHQGTSFGTISPTEEALASKMIEAMPWLEKLRFVSSGTEATMSALRVARAATGKKKIVKFIGNYHGHHDQLLVQAGSGVSLLNPEASSKGVSNDMVQHTLTLHFNDAAALRALLREDPSIAAVIVEPVAGNMGVVAPSEEFLTVLCEETRRAGALLIADEVMTGFRVGLAGAQGRFRFEADLSCFSKIMGGGFPVGAFGGKSCYMDLLAPLGEVYQAGTLSGNPVAMVAGLKTLEEVHKPGFYEELERKTQLLLDPIYQLIEERQLPLCINQVGSMFTLFFGPRSVSSKKDLAKLDSDQFKQFFSFMFERGIYIPPSQYEAWFISSAHTDEHLEQTQEVMLEFLNSFYGKD